MSSTDESGTKILVWRAVRNGFAAWLIGTVLYMIPALVVGFRMGFTLGPQLQNSAEVSRQISAAISTLYRGNMYLAAGYVVSVAILVFWRASVVSRAAGGKGVQHGTIVGSVPAFMEIVFLTAGIGGIFSVVSAVVYVTIGVYAGSRSSAAASSR